MTKENETIADIIAEKRRRADEIERDCAEKMKRGKMVSDCYARELVADIRQEADRMEAAHKRELEAVGNAAKLREALSKFCAYSAVVLNTGMFNRVHLEALLNMAKAALAEPPRNCDVGTVMEQGKRFAAFCYKNRNAESCCGDCPAFNKGTPRGAECELTWAQMPYEAEKGGAK